MDISIPSRPPAFDVDPNDPEYPSKLMAYQEQMSLWHMSVQAAQNQMTELTTTMSNMSKSNHDAIMAIIRNLG